MHVDSRSDDESEVGSVGLAPSRSVDLVVYNTEGRAVDILGPCEQRSNVRLMVS